MFQPRASVVTESLAWRDVSERLRHWLRRMADPATIKALNEELAASDSESELAALVESCSSAAAQSKAVYTHDAEMDRLSYSVSVPGVASAVTGTLAVRALFVRTQRWVLWRLANQELFALLFARLSARLSEEWPGGEVSVANVKEAGAGGHFRLSLPSDALAAPATAAAAAADGDAVGAAEGTDDTPEWLRNADVVLRASGSGTCGAGGGGAGGGGGVSEALLKEGTPIPGGELVAECTFRCAAGLRRGPRPPARTPCGGPSSARPPLGCTPSMHA